MTNWREEAIGEMVDAWMDFSAEYWAKPILQLEWTLGFLFYPIIEWLYFRLGGK